MIKRWRTRIFQGIWTVFSDPLERSRWWHRIRRGCGIVLLLLLLLACTSCVLLGALVGRATASETHTGLDVILVVDNSNSTFDKGGIGSDPELWRIEAAQMFINYLGVDSGQFFHRLGVVFFGGEAELMVPLTPLADQARRAEMASLIANPQRMDWTDPLAALELARDTVMGERVGGGQPVVVLLTDGKPEWDGNATIVERQAAVKELEQMGQDYAANGIRLFTILLSNEATDADPEIETVYTPMWNELAQTTKGRFYPVRQADDLIDIYHDILVVLSELQTDGQIVEAELEEETQVEMVAVEPGLARVTFVVRTGQTVGQDADLTVTIHRPDGEVLRPDDANVQHAAHGTTAIWAIAYPQPGNWTVVMAGRGTVSVWKDYLVAPVTPTVMPSPTPLPTMTCTPTPAPTVIPTPAPQLIVAWPEVVLAGQPFTLGVFFDPAPSETPVVWAEWAREGEHLGQARLLDDGREGDMQAQDGHYGTSLVLSDTGAVLVHVWGEIDRNEIDAREGRLRVEACPRLELTMPPVGDRWQAGQPAGVNTRWILDTELPEMTGPMTVTLRSADESIHATVTGTVGLLLDMDVPQATGPYSLTVQAMGRSATGLLCRGQAIATVVVHRSLPWWAWTVGTGMLLACIGGWGARYGSRRLPRVEGRLRVLEVPSGYAGPTLVNLSLLNRRSARLGGVDAELPIPASGVSWAVVRALVDGSGMELVPEEGQQVRVNDVSLANPHLLFDRDIIEMRKKAGNVRLRYERL